MQNDTESLSVDNGPHTCERCAPVNFGNLANTPADYFNDAFLFTIDDLSQPLTEPHCPTCQILQTAIDVHRMHNESASVRVFWRCLNPGRMDYMGVLHFKYPTGYEDEVFMPELTVYDTSLSRTPKIQPAPRRVDFERAKTWIDACKELHPGCPARSTKVLKNLRVIDCVTRSVILAPEDCVYVALSYVWGISKTCDAPNSSALPDQLPLTVDNSIHATVMLGYRYLWVDQYCIDQTSAADKHDQINQMGDIYSSAELTLIAAAGANSTYGLPGIDRDRKHFGHDVTIGRLRFVTTYGWNLDEIDRSVWSSRAWTFQEGYMSRRRLYLTDTRLIYICGSTNEVYCDAETGPIDTWTPLGLRIRSLPDKGQGLALANGILREYTRRKLTFDSDALNGIVGVLNTLSTAESPILHTWGVTFGGSPLAIALDWFHTKPCRRRKAIPSWSPLGWEGAANYYYNPDPIITPDFQVNVWANGEFVQLSNVNQSLLQQSGTESIEKTRYLEITAKLGWLEVRYFSSSELLSFGGSISIAKGQPKSLHTPLPGFCVRVSNDDEAVEVYTRKPSHWDLEPGPSSGSIRVPCAIIPQGHRYTFGDARMMVVIMLQNHGSHYERIGCFRYPHTFFGEGFILRDMKGALEVRDRGRRTSSYSDEHFSRDFKDPEMKTFLLG